MRIARVVLLLAAVVLTAAWPVSAAPVVVTNFDLQAVNANGSAANPLVGSSSLVTITGIVLNNPQDMLDTTPGSVGMGGQWQIYIQGIDGDLGATAAWMGQNYHTRGGISYTDAEWLDEIARLNYPLDKFGTAYQLQAGDLVKITGLALAFGGKTNINERHNSFPENDFTITWLGRPGLPDPELITLADVQNADKSWIFDQTRLAGAERYQGRLVRINGLSFAAGGDSQWGVYGNLTLTDGQGRTLPVKLGVNQVFADWHSLGNTFDVIGIFNQEAGTGDLTGGYTLWVLDYDGGEGMLGTPVPEPATMALLALGGLGLVAARRRRRR